MDIRRKSPFRWRRVFAVLNIGVRPPRLSYQPQVEIECSGSVGFVATRAKNAARPPRRFRNNPPVATTEDPRADTATDRWKAELYDAKPEREGELFSTMSGIENEPLYTEDNVEVGELGFPGMYPFTRGVYPSMYRGRLWTMRQFAGFGTAEETNERFRYLLEHGQTGLSTAFDMPTLMGYDSDHTRSLGEVGREGVAVDTLDDMEQLFAG